MFLLATTSFFYGFSRSSRPDVLLIAAATGPAAYGPPVLIFGLLGGSLMASVMGSTASAAAGEPSYLLSTLSQWAAHRH